MYVVAKNIEMYVVLKLRTYFGIIFEKQLIRLRKNICGNGNMRIFLSWWQLEKKSMLT
jgi:hypothetical protein